MRKTRSFQGRGELICGDERVKVAYQVDLISDELGNEEASGSLQLPASFAFQAALYTTCRLILENEQEMAVYVTPNPSGGVYIHSSGWIPDFD